MRCISGPCMQSLAGRDHTQILMERLHSAYHTGVMAVDDDDGITRILNNACLRARVCGGRQRSRRASRESQCYSAVKSGSGDPSIRSSSSRERLTCARAGNSGCRRTWSGSPAAQLQEGWSIDGRDVKQKLLSLSTKKNPYAHTNLFNPPL